MPGFVNGTCRVWTVAKELCVEASSCKHQTRIRQGGHEYGQPVWYSDTITCGGNNGVLTIPQKRRPLCA